MTGTFSFLFFVVGKLVSVIADGYLEVSEYLEVYGEPNLGTVLKAVGGLTLVVWVLGYITGVGHSIHHCALWWRW